MISSKVQESSTASRQILLAQQQQQRFESQVDSNIQKLLVNYRTLLKKYSSLSSPSGFGRHEELQIEAAGENMVHHAEVLLDLINDLRIRALILNDSEKDSGAVAAEEEMS